MTAWDEGGCWPTPQQELLLRARFVAKRRRLGRVARMEKPDRCRAFGLRLGALAATFAANLQAQGVDEALMKRFKSVARHAWCHNQMLFASAATVLQQLHDAGIQTMVLKGAALIAVGHYSQIGGRPMNDFDLMVPTSQAARAMELFRNHGWKPDTRGQKNHAHDLIDEKYLNAVFAQPFINERDQSFDLHRHLLPQCARSMTTTFSGKTRWPFA